MGRNDVDTVSGSLPGEQSSSGSAKVVSSVVRLTVSGERKKVSCSVVSDSLRPRGL